ncbi:MAG: histidine kinase [Pseudonocardia sp.]
MRARIAREMHDVVAHHLSLIAVRCETAPHRWRGCPSRPAPSSRRWPAPPAPR